MISLEWKSQLVSHADELKEADRILLPGVGAFGPAMEHLRNSGMMEALQEKVQAGTPLLGICVGAQLLMEEKRRRWFLVWVWAGFQVKLSVSSMN